MLISVGAQVVKANKFCSTDCEGLAEPIERFHSRGQRPYWFTKTKDDC